MQAGKLDRRITIQSATSTINSAGTPTLTWSDVTTVWAELVERSTREFIRTQGAQDERLAVFRIRWRSGVTTAHRVRFEGKAYNIKEVTTIGRKVGVEIRCVDVTEG